RGPALRRRLRSGSSRREIAALRRGFPLPYLELRRRRGRAVRQRRALLRPFRPRQGPHEEDRDPRRNALRRDRSAPGARRAGERRHGRAAPRSRRCALRRERSQAGRDALAARGRGRRGRGRGAVDGKSPRGTTGEGCRRRSRDYSGRSEEHTSELQSLTNLVCRLLLEKKKKAPTAVDASVKENNSSKSSNIVGSLKKP